MERENLDFLRTDPEGAIIVALDIREEELLFGAVELRSGEKSWLDYELESDLSGDTVSLFREVEDTPVFAYRATGRRVDTVSPPDRLLILWNRGRRALAVDGEPLSPGEVLAKAPEGTTPWLLRFASWLSRQE